MNHLKQNIRRAWSYWVLIVWCLLWLLLGMGLAGCGHVAPSSFGSGAGGSLTANIETAQQAIIAVKKAASDQWEVQYLILTNDVLSRAHQQAASLTERCSAAEQKLVELDDDWIGPRLRRTAWTVGLLGGVVYIVLGLLGAWFAPALFGRLILTNIFAPFAWLARHIGPQGPRKGK